MPAICGGPPVLSTAHRQESRYQASATETRGLQAPSCLCSRLLHPRFNGRETSTGSCLAFAPGSKTGANNQATEADWQAETKDDFIKLEPWAVPCGNKWMKDHWDKWQGYSFYSVDTSIEKCLTVTFALKMQPVTSLVGGISFSLLPGPLAEIDTQVCWPRHQPGGLDLSVLRSVIRSNNVLLFSRTLRLSKRFGDDTHFVMENVHGGHQTSRSFFGTSATDEESGTGMASMKRSSLLESNQSRAQAKARLLQSLRWETDEEDLYLASVEYGEDMGMNKTYEVRGSSARKRISSLLQSASKDKFFPDIQIPDIPVTHHIPGTSAEEVQETSPSDETADAIPTHQEEVVEEPADPNAFKLFEFKNPGLVNFEISGLLSGNWLQLGVQMGFGEAFQSPKMTIPLVNLGAQFALILDSMPDELVSAESRAKAIAALADFAISDIGDVISNSKVANVVDDVAGDKWSFSVNSPPVASGTTSEDSGEEPEERPPEVLAACKGAAAEGSSCSPLPEADCNGHYVPIAEGMMQCAWIGGRCSTMGPRCQIEKGLFHRELQPAAPSSMVAWFKSEDANPVWKSSVGSWQGHVTKGSVTRQVGAGNGATRPVAHLTGLTNAAYDFGKIMKPDFTICSITRYLEGGIMGRILQGDPNFLHGHHQGRTGLAYYGAWVTPQPQDVPSNTDWLVMCGNNRRVVFVGNDRSNIASHDGAFQDGADFNLYINQGFTDEFSDFGVMEVITWDRALSEDEMWTSMEYLNWKLRETLPHHPAAQSSMVAWFKSEDANPVWKSAVGSWQGRVTKGSITRKVEAGNGATRPVAYLAGDSSAGYDFGKIMKPDFTICSITRYVEGGKMERILQNNNPNFLHGHWQRQTGVAYYGRWVTFHHYSSNTDWLVMCGNNKGVLYLGKDQKNIGMNHGNLHNADFNLYINEGYTHEASDFGVMEVITWNRALSDEEMWTSMEYLNWKLQAHLAHRPSAESAMVAWFKSEDASPAWKSAVGSWQGHVTKGSVTRKFSAGSGAPVPVAYLAGDSNAAYDFGKIMKPDFTICSITRYLEGGIMGRILQGDPNFLHGHHNGRKGLAYYGAWVTPQPQDVPSNTDWLVMCGNNRRVVFVGNDRSNIASHDGAFQDGADFNLYINQGFTDEVSDFGVMEVITWDRALSEDEMWTSMEYLNWKLQATIPREPVDKRSMVAWFKSQDASPVWKSAVGSWQGRVTKGSIGRRVEAGSGATRPVSYLRGLSSAGYDFGKIMKPVFTICSITRYLEGGLMGRILQNNHPNFFHGHHGGHAGVAYYGAPLSLKPNALVSSNTDWLVMCGNNKGVVFVGNERINIGNRHGALLNADFNLYINEGFPNEVSDFGVMEVITWRRALSEDEMWTSMEYLNWKLQETFQVHPAAPSSMVAWFKSEDANPVWKSSVGSWQGRVIKGSIIRKVEAGSGATRPVAYLRGLSNAAYDFGKIMTADFTICSITRYLEGGIKGRILQNRHPNFIHGHHGGRTGLAYYGTWVTSQDVPSNTDWLVMCGNNNGVVFAGNDRSNIANGHGALQNAADFNLYINEGQTSEPSDFGVMEVITWNRALSEDEMWTSMEYLNWKLAKGLQ